MQFSNLNLFVKYSDIHFTKGPIKDKFLAFMVLSENDEALSAVKSINFSGFPIKTYIVPNSLSPFRTYMNSEYKQEIQKSGFLPYKSNIDEISKIDNKHIYIDTNRYISEIIQKWNITVFNHNKFKELFTNYFNSICKNINANHEKILLYTIDLDKNFSDTLLHRKVLPLYINMIKNIKSPETSVPFDKIILCTYSAKTNNKEYILVYDKTKKFNPSKIKTILTSYEPNAIPTSKDEKVADQNEEIADNFDDDEINKALAFKEFTKWKVDTNLLSEQPLQKQQPQVQPQPQSLYQPNVGIPAPQPVIGQPQFMTYSMLQNPAYLQSPVQMQPQPVQPQVQQAPVQPHPVQQKQVDNKPKEKPEDKKDKEKDKFKDLSPHSKNATKILGSSGSGLVALKMMDNKKKEDWYLNNCQELTGFKKSKCNKFVINMRINNLTRLTRLCNNDPNCIQDINKQIENLKKNV